MEEVIELRRKIFSISSTTWENEMLFSLKWWALILVVLVVWYVWWRFVNKERFVEICLVGFIAGLLSTILNSIGVEFTLWGFPDQLIGSIRVINVLDLTIIPVSYMLIYQYCPKWKPYLSVVFMWGFSGSFIGQPIFSYLDLYQLIKWDYILSLPVYIFIGVVVKLIVTGIMKVHFSAKSTHLVD